MKVIVGDCKWRKFVVVISRVLKEEESQLKAVRHEYLLLAFDSISKSWSIWRAERIVISDAVFERDLGGR